LTVAIIDYGVGNLGSIKNMLNKLGAEAVIAADSATIEAASKIILPGVGAFDFGMQRLIDSELKNALDRAALQRKVPVAGICLGMQLMTGGSEEGALPGLGWIDAHTVRFRPAVDEILKVPHMGWNSVVTEKSNPVLRYLDNDPRFYFVHSFYVKCREREDILLSAQYGSNKFDAAFAKDNIVGFQFHPEKSHRFGMALLKGFLEAY
jgi:glutamine amidotransferase